VNVLLDGGKWIRVRDRWGSRGRASAEEGVGIGVGGGVAGYAPVVTSSARKRISEINARIE
jgi:hypothetical protein